MGGNHSTALLAGMRWGWPSVPDEVELGNIEWQCSQISQLPFCTTVKFIDLPRLFACGFRHVRQRTVCFAIFGLFSQQIFVPSKPDFSLPGSRRVILAERQSVTKGVTRCATQETDPKSGD